MISYKISEAASRTGFTESALRFYEDHGMVTPGRTASGYRMYDDDDIEALRFVAWSKRLGLSLGEIRELLVLLDDEECRPVQQRMRSLVAQRIDQTQSQIAELIAFTGTLQRAAARLGRHTPNGACHDDCGCKNEPRSATEPGRTLIPLGVSTDITCSLEAGLVVDRVEDWKALIGQAEGRAPVPGGIRLTFPRDVDVAAMSELAVNEQTCCPFFAFSISIGTAVTLEVTGPDDAQPVIASIFGAAA